MSETEKHRSNYKPQMDWTQVALNGGPPCFAVLDDRPGWYCGRAERWEGHNSDHVFVPLDRLLSDAEERATSIINKFAICRDHDQASERTIDKLHRETNVPMWALGIAFELSELGMLDEETMAGTRVIPDAARVIAERRGDTQIRSRCCRAEVWYYCKKCQGHCEANQ